MREFHGLALDRFQEEAIEAIERGHNVIVSAPTGSGKTLIAEYAIDLALRRGRRIIYTAPIKALSNQKFRDFSSLYPGKVGIVTGDVNIGYPAPCSIMTTEIFRNTVLESPETMEGVSFVIFDEFHYIEDFERGTVWEESVIFAPPGIRFLCLSATIPNHADLAEWMEKIRGTRVEVIVEERRPVELETHLWVNGVGAMEFKELARLRKSERFGRGMEDRLIEFLQREDRLPCLYFCFSRALCEKKAKLYSRYHFLDKEERRKAVELFSSLAERYGVSEDPQVWEMGQLVSRGVAYHHAGMLPTLKEIVEQLFGTGLVKLLIATETFALGVNMPARTTVLESLRKFDGVRTKYLSSREFQQMSGRAGRRGMDEKGYVYARVGRFDSDIRAIKQIFYGEPEPVRSRFNLSYSTILSVYQTVGEQIFHLLEKSFVNYQGPFARRARNQLAEQLRRRFKVLRMLGYIEGPGTSPGDERPPALTARGRFAANIQGYELQLTECFFRGYLEAADEHELAVIFSAIVHEPRKGQTFQPLPHGLLRDIRPFLQDCVHSIRALESRVGVSELTRNLDFSMGATIYAWSTGARFEELAQYATADPGDLVRSFRLVIQLLRQAADAAREHEALRSKLLKAVASLNRDVVDAERQLRLGISED